MESPRVLRPTLPKSFRDSLLPFRKEPVVGMTASTKTTQAEPRLCPACHRPVASHAPEGLCLVCLLDTGLADATSMPDTTDPSRPSDSGGPTPRYFGDFEIVREAGRGGMGIVFEARQFGTQRVVALKLLAAGATATRDAVQRFHAEAQAAARLEHPHIVPIHETGMHEGQYYLAMRFLPGGTLAAAASARPLGPRRAAQIVRTVSLAIQHAHQHGVLHRDLKPGNILLDDAGEPHVADFGLARLTELDSHLTLPSTILGTAAYMAPEQAAGGPAAVTTAADIYGLGAVLYELLSGRAPFVGRSLAEVLRRVQDDTPAPPNRAGTRTASIPSDLETICLKCLEKDPTRRYGTAQELADDLGRFLDHEPVHARPVTGPERVWRWCRREPALAAALVSVGVLGLVVTIGSPIAALHIRRERDHASAEALRARRSEYAADMLLAQQALAENQPGWATELVDKHHPAEGTEADMRGWEWRHLADQTRSDELLTLGHHQTAVYGLAFAPDGRSVASSGFDGSLSVWARSGANAALASIKETEPGNANPSLFAVAISPDGRVLACGGDIEPIRLRDPGTLQEIGILETGLRVLSLAFSPDGRWLAAAGVQGLEVFDLVARRPVARSPAAGEWLEPRGLSFSPDGRLLASAHDPQTVTVYAVPDFTKIRELRVGKEQARSLAFSPDGSRLAIGAEGLTIWRVTDGQPVATLSDASAKISALAYSPDGTLLAASGRDLRIGLWKAADGAPVASLGGHRAAIHRLAFSPDGEAIASASADGTVRLWPAHPPARPPEMAMLPKELSRYFRTRALSGDGLTLAVARTNGTAFEIWDLAALAPIARHELRPGQRFLTNWTADVLPLRGTDPASPGERVFVCLAVDSQRRRVALGDARGALVLRRLDGAEPEVVLQHNTDIVDCACFSRDGRLLANTSWDGVLSVHDLDTGRELTRQSIVPQLSTMQLVFSPDGSLVASGDYNGDIRLCGVAGRRSPLWLKGHRMQVSSLAFTPDGSQLVSSAFDQTVRFWDTRTGQVRHEIRGEDVTSLAISADGTRLARGSGDEVSLWEMGTHQQVGRLKGQVAYPRLLAFQDAGDALVGVGADGIRVWRAPRKLAP